MSDLNLDVWHHHMQRWLEYGHSDLWATPSFLEWIGTKAQSFDGERLVGDFEYLGGAFTLRARECDRMRLAVLIAELRPDLVETALDRDGVDDLSAPPA